MSNGQRLIYLQSDVVVGFSEERTFAFTSVVKHQVMNADGLRLIKTTTNTFRKGVTRQFAI